MNIASRKTVLYSVHRSYPGVCRTIVIPHIFVIGIQEKSGHRKDYPGASSARSSADGLNRKVRRVSHGRRRPDPGGWVLI